MSGKNFETKKKTRRVLTEGKQYLITTVNTAQMGIADDTKIAVRVLKKSQRERIMFQLSNYNIIN